MNNPVPRQVRYQAALRPDVSNYKSLDYRRPPRPLLQRVTFGTPRRAHSAASPTRSRYNLFS
jgi:hypothetical protein